MARRGNDEQRERGTEWQGLGLCVVMVHVRVCCACACACACVCVILLLVDFGLMSSVMGHSLDWPWNGSVSRLCARTDGQGAMLSLALSPNSDPRDSRTSSDLSGLGTGRPLAALAIRMGQTLELGSRQLARYL